MVYANGDPTPGETIRVEMFKDGVLERSIEPTTDSKGQVVCIFPTTKGADKITFIVNSILQHVADKLGFYVSERHILH